MKELIKQHSINDAIQIGETFYKSGMFADIKSAQQAVVKILAGAELGISPFASMAGIHIIQGKPTIGAGLMAARVKSFGKYDYKVIEHNDKTCSIDFYKGDEKLGNSTFTIEDAKKAGTKNMDKFPKNMLFARAISNGVKFYTPDIYEMPVYVPEEMQQLTVDVPHEEVKLKLNDIQFNKLLERIASGEDLSEKIKAIDLSKEQQNYLDMLKKYIAENPGKTLEELKTIIANEKV